MEALGREMCAHYSQGGQGSPKGHSRARGLREAERRGGGRGRGGPRRGGSGEAGGAAPEESASGRGGCRLAPPRGTERAASAPARETPATGGASTSEEGGRSERSAALGPGLGVGRRAPAEARATPWSSALAPRQGQVSGCGDSGARARGGGEVRGREPGASARLCRAEAALWRAVDTLPARGSAAADFFWRTGKAERGCERHCVCVARAGATGSLGSEPLLPAASRQPSEGTQPVRSAPGGQRPVTPGSSRCLCGGSQEARAWDGRGCGAAGSAEAEAAGGAPRTALPEPKGLMRGSPGGWTASREVRR